MIFSSEVMSIITRIINKAAIPNHPKLFSILLMAFCAISWAATEINLTRSPIAVLGLSLATAPDHQKTAFVLIALNELYASYEAALTRAYKEYPRKLKKRRKINSWRHATKDYLDNIQYVSDYILSGNPFDFFINRQDIIIVSVSGQVMMITGPNNKSDRLIETNILNQFCKLYDCHDYFSASEGLYVNSLRTSVSGHWSMSKKGKNFITDIGLVFRFDKLSDRKAKEKWSLDLANELSILVETLELCLLKGYSIDWDSISLSSDQDKDGKVILTINQQEDFTKITLPLLSKNTKIFFDVKPWIQQILQNRIKVVPETILSAEQYFR